MIGYILWKRMQFYKVYAYMITCYRFYLLVQYVGLYGTILKRYE